MQMKTFNVRGYYESTGASFKIQIQAKSENQAMYDDALENPDMVIQSITQLLPPLKG